MQSLFIQSELTSNIINNTAGGKDHKDEDRDPLEESRKVGIAALFTLKLEDLNEISFLKKKFSSNTHKSVFLTWILKSGSRPKGEQFIWERGWEYCTLP